MLEQTTPDTPGATADTIMNTKAAFSLFFTAAALFLYAAAALAQQPAPPVDQDALARWQDMRFGMFIHWGPVSIKGTEIGWSRGREVPREEYDQLYTQFNPAAFDAREWVQLAKDAGMRYVVLTSKHHDGFCLWDTALTDYNIMNTPFRRDVIAELSAACKEAGLAFGTYYSILDWYQPHYNAEGAQGGPGYALPAGEQPDMDRYQDYLEGHVRELVTKYGPLIVMWFDGEWEKPWNEERGERLYRFCRNLDPKMLVNNRVGKARHGMEGVTKEGALAPGDFDTPEQTVGAYNVERPWETCMTLGSQWAWKPGEEIKSLSECIRILVSTAGGGGNLLLNVGPMPNGEIGPEQAARLREIGQWMKTYGESVYGTRGGPFRPGQWGCSTHKGNTVYIHVFEWDGSSVRLPKPGQPIRKATRLDSQPIEWRQTEDGVELIAEPSAQDPIDTVIALELAE